MRQGRTFKRCSHCGARVADKRCPKCNGDSFSWSFVVDTAAVGEKRQQRMKGGFPTKAAALEAMAGIQTAKKDGSYVESSRQTLGAYLTLWVAGGCRGAKDKAVRPWTAKGYESVVRVHLIPHLGGVPLQQLTAPALRAFYAKLRTSGLVKGKRAGSGLSEKSVHNVHICLRAALNRAVADGLLRTNPAAGAAAPPDTDHEMLTWTREELASFLDAIATERDQALWRLAAYTGMRRGEVLGLRWSDVKWQTNSLSVQQQLGPANSQGDRLLAPPKTHKGRRSISLDGETLRLLEDHQRAQQFERNSWGDAYKDRDLVFCRPDGSAHDADTITGRFEQLIKQTGMKRIRLHDLRHTHATHCLEAGIDISVVSRRLGHADVGFTARVYAHLSERLQTDAAAKISAYLEPKAVGL